MLLEILDVVLLPAVVLVATYVITTKLPRRMARALNPPPPTLNDH